MRAFGLTRSVTLRGVRLATGLVLFSYVLTHFLNHALGNVSLGAMESGLEWVAWFWGLTVPGFLLYASLAIHGALGIWAVYARPRFQWRLSQCLQLGLGLLIPALLTQHVVNTRLAYTLYGSTLNYAQELYYFWVLDPARGIQQAVALPMIWAHGCFGIYFWLRLKRGFPAYAPVLLCAAVLVPVLALLGYAGAGRAVLSLAADPSWRVENVPLAPAESPALAAKLETLTRWRVGIQAAFAAAVAAAIGARLSGRVIERRRGLIRLMYPDGRAVRVPRGTSVLEASRISKIPHANVCGGRGRCSTCRVQLFGVGAGKPPPGTEEDAVLKRIGAGPDIRLACQFRPVTDVTVAPLVDPDIRAGQLGRLPSAFGEERFVVAMFVDMRGSTRLAEQHLPFDTVFKVNRFLEAIAAAVRSCEGVPNQFLGDGMLALFGLTSDPASAARDALAATAAIGRHVADLNASAAPQDVVRFGIGLHAGTAVLGEVGERGRGHSVFTAIGDTINVAARLQSATKRFGVEALVSRAVFDAAGRQGPVSVEDVSLEGRDEAVPACPIPLASGLRPGDGAQQP